MENVKNIGVILLAAGQGTRMKSDIPKVLHSLGGKPLFLHALGAALRLKPARVAVVVGHGSEAVRQAYRGEEVTWVVQEKQLGTGHAVRCAESVFQGFSGSLVILSGDVPLISEQTLRAMITRHDSQNAALTLLTAKLAVPRGYGRILKNGRGEITGVVEEKDATVVQKQIEEVNAGAYVASPQFLFMALARVGKRNQQGEYYLPDVVGIGLKQGQRVASVKVEDAREIMGVNTREELAYMEKRLREKINQKWMAAGVTLKDPQTTYIDEEVTIGRDTIIGPNTHLRGRTVIGQRCQIDGTAYLTDAAIADGVHLRFAVVMTGCRVGQSAIIGPFAHLRPGSSLDRSVHIGNFVETKEATIGEGTKANHLTYLGDVTIGAETNIGAGTITCNYDGFQKYRTTIGNRVQVGSDSTLVAPVTLGDDAYIATATTLRHDVPAGALAFNERQEQLREGWTQEKRERMKGAKK